MIGFFLGPVCSLSRVLRHHPTSYSYTKQGKQGSAPPAAVVFFCTTKSCLLFNIKYSSLFQWAPMQIKFTSQVNCVCVVFNVFLIEQQMVPLKRGAARLTPGYYLQDQHSTVKRGGNSREISESMNRRIYPCFLNLTSLNSCDLFCLLPTLPPLLCGVNTIMPCRKCMQLEWKFHRVRTLSYPAIHICYRSAMFLLLYNRVRYPNTLPSKSLIGWEPEPRTGKLARLLCSISGYVEACLIRSVETAVYTQIC
jgi:hypothetical protein